LPKNTASDSTFLSDVQTFARLRKDAEFTLEGTAMIGEQECLKIVAKISYESAPLRDREFTYVFYAAKNLRNLVIGVDLTSRDSYASSRLGNIIFDFPDKLFRKPEGYRLKRPS
jgi:hypothetical protein